MFLLLDPSLKDEMRYLLWEGANIIAEEKVVVSNREMLQGLVSVLEKNNFVATDIQGIAVIVGEGGFTSTRIATTIANAWSLANHIPVVGVSIEHSSDLAYLNEQLKKVTASYIQATYRSEPNIGPQKVRKL